MATKKTNGQMTTNQNGHGSLADIITLNRYEEQVENLTTRSAEFFRQFLDPRRSIEDECGFPETITLSEYKFLYDREPIAARVVEVFPKECWLSSPRVYEDEDPEAETDFEVAWDEVGKSLRGEHNWFYDEEGSPVWRLLAKVDCLSGIGSFGVIFLGFDDGRPLNEPVEFSPGSGERKLLYARALSEDLVQVTKRETDKTKSRYGWPTEYNITMESLEDSSTHFGGSLPVGIDFAAVHWSRVLHVADTWHAETSSEIFAMPRMKQVWNHLLGLRKVEHGDPEAFWKNCVMKVFFETHPQLGGDVNVDEDSLRNMMENFSNGLQPWGMLRGMAAKTVAPAVLDPKSHVESKVKSICVKLGCPERIFYGSQPGGMGGKGDAESSGDDWDTRKYSRCVNYLTPCLIVPFVNRLIAVGVLPIPEEGFHVKWDEPGTLTAKQQAEIGLTRTQAMVAYVGGSVEALMSPMDYLTRELGYSDEEADNILENAADHGEEAFQNTDEDFVPGHVPEPPTPEPPAPELPEKFGGGGEEEEETEDDAE